jgi:hypothetical protein
VSHRRWVWLLVAAVVVALGALIVDRGRTGRGGLWLDGEPDPTAASVALFVFGSCSPHGEEVRSVFLEESRDAVSLDVRIRLPIGLGSPACGSYQGTPLVVPLEAPLGDRSVLVINPDGSKTPILPSPFAQSG